MKNTIYIDIDTEREQPILIGKGPETEQPTSREEAGKMIINDIACVCDALITLIHVAEQNEYAKKDELVGASISQLNLYLNTKIEGKSSDEEKVE
jgi:hypothetical protein